MIVFERVNKALKCVWINRLMNEKRGAWKLIPDDATVYLGVAMQLQI